MTVKPEATATRHCVQLSVANRIITGAILCCIVNLQHSEYLRAWPQSDTKELRHPRHVLNYGVAFREVFLIHYSNPSRMTNGNGRQLERAFLWRSEISSQTTKTTPIQVIMQNWTILHE